MLERFFGLKKHGTTVRVEFSAALTTFFSMAYILMVNAEMFSNPLGDGSNPLGVSYGAVYMATALYYLLGLTVPGFYANLSVVTVSPAQAFSEFLDQSFLRIFREGFDFSAYIAAHGGANLALTIATSALAFCMVDMFDTLGTLYAACERGGLLDEQGEIPNMDRAMLSDAAATVMGSV